MLPQDPGHQPTAYTPDEKVNTSLAPTTPFGRLVETPGPQLSRQHFGPYELLRRIGRGGLGDVYRARHLPTGAVVALKVLRAGDDANPAELRSFEREIQAALRLCHPRILPILDTGLIDGQPFYTMPLVPGGNLEKRLRTGRVDWRQGVKWLAQVARAVHHAHQQQILHRDLKPANILLDESDQPLVADFGLAKFLDQNSGLTMTGQLMGSLPYMSPEQAAGHSHRATPGTDVWQLGVILYELLTGQRPFSGETQTEVLSRIQRDDPPPLRSRRADVPADLEAICLRCLSKEPGLRYASAALLADDLERWLRDERVHADPAIPAPLQSLVRRLRLPAVPVVLALLGLLLAGLLVLSPTPPTKRDRLRALLALARPGKPVTLLGERGEPLWGHIALGGETTRLNLAAPGGPWLNTPAVCLWELLPPDPKRKDFRLQVEMAHTDGDNYGQAGVYAGHRFQKRPRYTLHTLIQATYCDPSIQERGQPVRARPIPLALGCAVLVERAVGPLEPHRVQPPITAPLSIPFVPTDARGDRYCTFSLEVRETGWGMNVSDKRSNWSKRESSAHGLSLLRRVVPEAPAAIPALSPRGGAGIVVWRGTVTMRRVLYEPLTAP